MAKLSVQVTSRQWLRAIRQDHALTAAFVHANFLLFMTEAKNLG